MSEKIKEMFCMPVYERSLLSYSIKNIENYYSIISVVSEQDFLRPEHKLIWVIIGTLIKRGVSKIDAALIVNEAQVNGVIKEIGGYEYITAILNMDLSDDNIQYYIQKVLNASTKYQLYMKLNYDMRKISNGAGDEDISAADMLSMVGTDVMDLSMKSNAVKEATNLSDGLMDYIEDRKNNPVEFCGLSTGYSILDKRLDGLVPGTLTVFCARPKMGKSTFMCNIASHVAFRLLKPVLYVDTEMSFDEWRARMLSMLSGVPERKIKHGGYTDQEYYNITQAAKLIEKGKIFHEYIPGYSVEKISALYKKYQYVEGIELAIFDYIKEPPGASNADRKEHQILGDVTTALKDLAGELQIPFLCANQLNRQEDVADSDRILRYADVLMFFGIKKKEEIEDAGIGAGTHRLVIKNSRRGGETPAEGIGYSFYKSTLQIYESEQQVIDYSDKENKTSEEIEYGNFQKEVLVNDGSSDDEEIF